MSLTPELLPCPFCGKSARIVDDGPVFLVECENCCAASGRAPYKPKAAQFWNRRAPGEAVPSPTPPAPPGLKGARECWVFRYKDPQGRDPWMHAHGTPMEAGSTYEVVHMREVLPPESPTPLFDNRICPCGNAYINECATCKPGARDTVEGVEPDFTTVTQCTIVSGAWNFCQRIKAEHPGTAKAASAEAYLRRTFATLQKDIAACIGARPSTPLTGTQEAGAWAYGIIDKNGRAHMSEVSVCTDPGVLWDEARDATESNPDRAPFAVVPLYAGTPQVDPAEPEDDDEDGAPGTEAGKP